MVDLERKASLAELGLHDITWLRSPNAWGVTYVFSGRGPIARRRLAAAAFWNVVVGVLLLTALLSHENLLGLLCGIPLVVGIVASFAAFRSYFGEETLALDASRISLTSRGPVWRHESVFDVGTVGCFGAEKLPPSASSLDFGRRVDRQFGLVIKMKNGSSVRLFGPILSYEASNVAADSLNGDLDMVNRLIMYR
jgi:hypothetical protein